MAAGGGRRARIAGAGGGKTPRRAGRACGEATAENICLSSVGERNDRLRDGIRKSRRVEAMVDELIGEMLAYDGRGRDPVEKVAAAARRMLMTQAVEAISQMKRESFDDLTPETLARMVNALERTRISAERLRLEYEDGFAAAKGAILREVRESLHAHPEVLAKLQELTVEAARALEERV